ncbi:PAP2 superfamily protein [uncultured archaeon]|nr:PAP2 superfamily protein [uncultured archaeon]
MDLSLIIYSLKSTFFDNVSIFIQDYYIVFVLLGLILTGIFVNRKTALKILIAVLLMFAVASLIKDFTQEPRPCQVYALKNLECLTTQGFPSIHAGMSAIFLFFLIDTSFAFAAFLLSILVMFSRVFIGAHSIPQVIAGFCFGIMCCKLSGIIGDKIDKHVD